jgi:hypothetical protein
MATLVLAGRKDAAAQGKPGRAAMLAAFAIGLTIATYTVVDGIGVRRSGSPVGYIAGLMLLMSLARHPGPQHSLTSRAARDRPARNLAGPQPGGRRRPTDLPGRG